MVVTVMVCPSSGDVMNQGMGDCGTVVGWLRGVMRGDLGRVIPVGDQG